MSLPPRVDASFDDILAGAKEGWRVDENGKRLCTPLDPVRLTLHFRRIGAQWKGFNHPIRGWLWVNPESMLPVLWLALAERGWIIDRRSAIDAWNLAALTPEPAAPKPCPSITHHHA